jgi:hypothetical protein
LAARFFVYLPMPSGPQLAWTLLATGIYNSPARMLAKRRKGRGTQPQVDVRNAVAGIFGKTVKIGIGLAFCAASQ